VSCSSQDFAADVDVIGTRKVDRAKPPCDVGELRTGGQVPHIAFTSREMHIQVPEKRAVRPGAELGPSVPTVAGDAGDFGGERAQWSTSGDGLIHCKISQRTSTVISWKIAWRTADS